MDSQELASLMAEFESKNGKVELTEIIVRDFMSPREGFMHPASLEKQPDKHRDNNSVRPISKRTAVMRFIRLNSNRTAQEIEAATGVSQAYIRALAAEYNVILPKVKPDHSSRLRTPERVKIKNYLKDNPDLRSEDIAITLEVHRALVVRVARETGYKFSRNLPTRRKKPMKEAIDKNDSTTEGRKKSCTALGTELGCTAEYVRRIRYHRDKNKPQPTWAELADFMEDTK